MVAHAMNYVMRIGYGDELTWPGRVARGDGFQVRITEMAIDLATERLSATCDYIGKEIAGELGVALEQPRTKYRVLPRISRDEPQAPEWFMPPEGNEPPKPSRSPSGRRNLEPSAAEDAVASRDPATATDEAAPQRQRIEGLH